MNLSWFNGWQFHIISKFKTQITVIIFNFLKDLSLKHRILATFIPITIIAIFTVWCWAHKNSYHSCFLFVSIMYHIMIIAKNFFFRHFIQQAKPFSHIPFLVCNFSNFEPQQLPHTKSLKILDTSQHIIVRYWINRKDIYKYTLFVWHMFLMHS